MKYQMKEHFSHQHLLLALQLEEGDKIEKCQGCEEQISDPILIHGCLSCDFYLHDNCADAPRSLEHQSHPLHPLTLVPTPTYSNRTYGCSACGSDGKAFCYSCAHCEFDLHLKCASMPNSLVIKEHPHELELIFDSTYQQQGCVFVCDVCNGVVKPDHWVYYCKLCDFGAHLGCVAWKGFLEKELWETKRVARSKVEVKDVPRTSKGGDSTKGNYENNPKSKVLGMEGDLKEQELDLQKEIFSAQRKMREQTLAHQIMLEALDNAADYVGPSYSKRYYYY